MSSAAVDILLVEDDQRLADLTAEYFRQNGLTVAIESRGDRAMARFKDEQPRLILLDLMLPGTDGLTVCRELREIFDGPILIFTARDSDIDQVIGLEAGADDYVAKPIDPMVLLARTRALLRRVEKGAEQAKPIGEIVLGGLRISEAAQEVWLDGSNIELTTQEFELLCMLARHAGKILSREEIFAACAASNTTVLIDPSTDAFPSCVASLPTVPQHRLALRPCGARAIFSSRTHGATRCEAPVPGPAPSVAISVIPVPRCRVTHHRHRSRYGVRIPAVEAGAAGRPMARRES